MLCFFWFSVQVIDGCLDKIKTVIEKNALIIAGVAIGVTAIEVHQPFYVLPPQNVILEQCS